MSIEETKGNSAAYEQQIKDALNAIALTAKAEADSELENNRLVPSSHAPAMLSDEIAALVKKRHDNVKRTIETLAAQGVIRLPQFEVSENINNLGLPQQVKVYVFEGEKGKRDSIVVVAQLSPEYTAGLVDRWGELERNFRQEVEKAVADRYHDWQKWASEAQAYITKLQFDLAAMRSELMRRLPHYEGHLTPVLSPDLQTAEKLYTMYVTPADEKKGMTFKFFTRYLKLQGLTQHIENRKVGIGATLKTIRYDRRLVADAMLKWTDSRQWHLLGNTEDRVAYLDALLDN